MGRLNPNRFDQSTYRRAELHTQDQRRKGSQATPLDKAECIRCMKLTFPIRLANTIRTMQNKTKGKKKQPGKEQFKADLLKQEQSKKGKKLGLRDLYKDTANKYNDEHPQQRAVTTSNIRQCVDTEAIDFFALWFTFLDDNIDHALDEHFASITEGDDDDDSSQFNYTTPSIKVISRPLTEILRTDLTVDEKKVFMNTIDRCREVVSDKMMDLSTILALDLTRRATGPPVDIMGIIPEKVQRNTMDSPLTVAPPSNDLKNKMLKNDSIDGRKYSDLYSSNHLQQMLTSITSSTSSTSAQQSTSTAPSEPSSSSSVPVPSSQTQRSGFFDFNRDDMKDATITPSPPGMGSIMSTYVTQYATNLKIMYEGKLTDYILGKALYVLLRCHLSPNKEEEGSTKYKKETTKETTKETKAESKKPSKPKSSTYALLCRRRRDQNRIHRIQKHDHILNPEALERKKRHLKELEQVIELRKTTITTTATTATTTVPTGSTTTSSVSQEGTDTGIDPTLLSNEPSAKRLQKLARLLKALLLKNSLPEDADAELLQSHVKYIQLKEIEVPIILKLYHFFLPFVLPRSYNKSVDQHPIFQYPLILLCNSILYITDYRKFQRLPIPTKNPSTLAAIFLDARSLYNLFCLLKFRQGGQRIKAGETAPLNSLGFDVFFHGNVITSEAKAVEQRKSMFGAFFNLPFIEELCRKVSGYSFDYRLIVTTFGVVRIQIKKNMALTTTATTSTLTSSVATSSTATTSVAATTGKIDRKGKRKQQVVITTDTSKRRKTQSSSGDDKMLKVDEQLSKLKDNMKEPTMELAQVNAEISKITNTLNSMAASFGSGNIGGSTKQQRQKRYKRKKLAQVDISSLVSSSTSKNDLIKNRSQMKARRDKLISQLLQIENSRSQLKDEKKEAFEEAYVEDNDTIIANTSPVFQATTSDQLLVGCDPGLSTMLQTTYADKQKVSFHLSLDNRFQPLEQFSQEMDLDDDHSIRIMMKLPTFPISSKDIDNKTMSKRSRTKMNNKKANDDTIMQTEADLANFAVNVALSYNKEAIINKHKKQRENANKLRSFYQGKWCKQQRRSQPRMKQRGLNHVMKYHRDRIQYHHSAATSTINSNVDLKFFYGAAGRGTGSRIKGFLRRSQLDVIATIEQQSKVFITDEYRTTKLCCLCHHVVNHPRKQSGKLNLGTVICVNPECIGKKFGCIARSRDANASMNMIMSGLQQELYGSVPSPFLRSSSSS